MNLRDELLQVREEWGALTPSTLLEAARPKNHPLHGRIFDRPVKEAAEEYYLSRAHQLIRSARIRFPTIDPSDRRTVRAFTAVRNDGEVPIVYEPSELVAASPLLCAMQLREMEREWRTFKARWENFAQFAEMIQKDLGEQAA